MKISILTFTLKKQPNEVLTYMLSTRYFKQDQTKDTITIEPGLSHGREDYR